MVTEQSMAELLQFMKKILNLLIYGKTTIIMVKIEGLTKSCVF